MQVQISTTRLYLGSMTNVLRETSQDREYLNRLRAYGLPDLGDAYLISIDTSDGQHVSPQASSAYLEHECEACRLCLLPSKMRLVMLSACEHSYSTVLVADLCGSR